MRGRTNGRRRRLLTDHEVSEHDAKIVYAALLLLHGYGGAETRQKLRPKVLLTNDRTAYALDTSHDGLALVSVPVFCGRLVERIAAEASGHWDNSLINTNYRL